MTQMTHSTRVAAPSLAPRAAVGEIVDQMIASTLEVFETMVFATLGAGAPLDGDAPRPRANVVGTVAFTGSASGVVAVYSTLECAREITGGMLGMPPGEVTGEVADAMGEVTNMIAGSLRTRMAAHGNPWAISVPTVTIGSDFYTKYVSDVRRVLCPFRMHEHEVFVELILTKD